MGSRTRTEDKMEGISGVYQKYPPNPQTVIKTARVGTLNICDDSTMKPPYVDQALLIKKTKVQYPRFSGTQYDSGGFPIRSMTECPCDYQPGAPSPSGAYPPLSTIEQSSLAWDSLAATNPNVSHVSLPTYWAELKDLPALFQSWGSSWLKEELPWRLALVKAATNKKQFKQFLKTATYPNLSEQSALFREVTGLFSKGYLTWRWAIRPMIDDIRKMFSFVDAVEQRIQWLSRLMSGKRVLKRRATLRTNSTSDAPSTAFVVTQGAFITGTQRVYYHERVWCVVKWRLDDSVNIKGVGLDGDPLTQAAYKLTFGISHHDALAALWQIMPWSWFVDWFLHISTVIDATNNTIPMTSSDTCLMRTTGATRIITLNPSSDLSWCKPSGEYFLGTTWKQRLIVNPVLPFAPTFMPVFTGSQMSILGTLTALRLVNLKPYKY